MTQDRSRVGDLVNDVVNGVVDGMVDDAVDAVRFRHVVGHLPSGVTVITTRVDDTDHGMTASSVTSLSIEPPLMLACLNNAVPTTAAVARAGRFIVNVLAQGQVDLAHQFAAPSRDKFRGIGVQRYADGTPRIAWALAHLECEVTEQITGGTHSIFIGHVVSATAQEGRPLTYFRGGFGRFEFARNDAAYERVRDMVLGRVFGAGDVIGVEELAERLGVDRSTAFYSLTRLAADALVRRDPDIGYVVTPFDVRTSDETFDARLAVELGVIDLCLDTVTDEGLTELRRRFETMAALLVGDRFVAFHDYLDANYAFHECLVSLAGNSLLTSTFGRLSIKSVMTRSFGSTPESSQRFIEVQRELLEAFEARDAVAARAAARDYCELAKHRVREILALTGGRL